ncbi:uncharacterized protein LOC110973038 [Acanthaster planci]|uniref:Uncharacterized protein LOC110973038 n=1 Tax=Acanthaster planci TaxID=133434 RepID=A0A8B7XFX3_ACAPL|nr:uncharacterized protein LOC110973038 [Acanthaster planci]XP_022079152.1 uncharacterized protein LOC110973038 [Acanthaster planci]XP_022079153.1 uncharacterized protein LOC110973038 [Acanthaster planci]
MAVDKEYVDVASLLVNRGADLSVTIMVNKQERTALDIAKEKELKSLVAVIEKKMQANQRLLAAVQDGNSNSVQEAIRNGANINLLHKEDSDSLQINLLFLALEKGHVDTANTLILGGIDLHFTVTLPDQTTEDTARSYAERLNHDDLVRLIDQEMTRQKSSPEANSHNENSHEAQQAGKTSGTKSSGELEDIEDADLEEDQDHSRARPAKLRRKYMKAGPTCIVC